MPDFRAAALAWIEQAEAAGGAVITSRLSRLECSVKPLRDGNTELLARFEGFLAREGLALAGITAEVVDRNSPRGGVSSTGCTPRNPPRLRGSRSWD